MLATFVLIIWYGIFLTYTKLINLFSTWNTCSMYWQHMLTRKCWILVIFWALNGTNWKIKIFLNSGGKNPDDPIFVVHRPKNVFNSFLLLFFPYLQHNTSKKGPSQKFEYLRIYCLPLQIVASFNPRKKLYQTAPHC